MSATFAERLEEARRLVAQARSANPPPAHHLDQLGAATEEVHHQVLRIGKTLTTGKAGRKWWLHTGAAPAEIPDEVAARCFAVLTELTRCPHLERGGPQPAWGRLALHRIDCGRCMATLRLPPADESDRCDWCGRRGVVVFSAVVIQTGPAVLFGDACGECGAALHWFEEKAS